MPTTVLRPVRKPASREQAALWIQSWWRMAKTRQQYKRIWHRQRVAREIWSSEQRYVAQIEDAFARFWKPLEQSAKTGKPLASENDIEVIFSRLGDILPLNRFLLELLDQRVEKWNVDSCIGDVFLEFARHNSAAFQSTYEQYTVHYHGAIARVQQCSANPKFREWLDALEATGKSLQSFLILPIQRLARYVLLLRQMRKYTHDTHRDVRDVNQALELMQVVVEAINEAERSADSTREAQRNLRELNARLEPRIGDLLQDPERRWLGSGELAHLTLLDMRIRSRHYELLSDTLLLTKARNRRRLALKQRASLRGARARPLEANDLLAFGRAAANMKHVVELHTPSQGFVFAFGNEQERAKFLSLMENECKT